MIHSLSKFLPLTLLWWIISYLLPCKSKHAQLIKLLFKHYIFTLVSKWKVSGSLLQGRLISGWWRKQMCDFGCPMCAEHQANLPCPLGAGRLYLLQQMNLFFLVSDFPPPCPSPSHPWFEIIFDFAFLVVGLECWSQYHWHFRQEMAFPSSEGVLL